jgi:aspartate aminotransferase
MRKAFDERRKKIVSDLNKIPGVDCRMPQGAFYVFPYINEVYKLPGFLNAKKQTSESSLSKIFCNILLEKYDVAAVPGIAFGDDNAIRLSYALGQAAIDKGVERIARMVKDLGA